MKKNKKQKQKPLSSSSSSGISIKKFLIPLEEFILATENFSPKAWIGDGGYGVVYKGQLSEHWQNLTVAIKRVNKNSKQGEKEFRNELEMMICTNHEKINTFIGYCDEGNEMIIAYEYAVNGSLDYLLQDPSKMRSMTWAQRLKICIGAARGLEYLHSGLEDHKMVIHRNVKSANILLDANMEAMINGFDLSVFGSKYQPHTHVYRRPVGTEFYLDPVYFESGIPNIETDVYSFGVVLFEMLSGTMASHERSIGDAEPGPLINLVRRYCDEGLEKLIDPNISDQIDSRSFNSFKDIACQCLSFNLKERPTMNTIIQKIEEALEFQNIQ